MKRRSATLAGLTIAAALDLATPYSVPGERDGTAAQTTKSWPTLLIWNASASVPRGLYMVRGARPFHVGELVTVEPPKPLARYMALRGYLPDGVPLLKHIAALPGQTVCRVGRTITIDGHATARALQRDSHGRLLPIWTGCRQVHKGEVFLLNPRVPDSFDGRYLGVLPASTITARAVPLWTIPGR
jgi:conjugative transfer signal peptidase TraF